MPNRTMRKRLWRVLDGLAIVMVLTTTSDAQTRPGTFPPVVPRADTSTELETDAPSADEISGLKTSVEFDILSADATAALEAHRWAEVLQPFGVTVRIRSPKAGDQLGVSENVQGTLRWVIVRGELNASGALTFPDRSFTTRQSTQLKEWIDELKLYGAQGAPQGKPLWGLTSDQFEKVFGALSVPVESNVQGVLLEEALRLLPLPEDMQIRYHSTAVVHLAAAGSRELVRPQVRGMSLGSALAAVLGNFGVGFRPLRTPAGDIELVVEPLANLEQPWPIGWEPEPEASRGKMAPGLFRMVPVGFENVPLESILDAVAEVAAIPVVVNHYSAAQKGIDLKQTLVSYPSKRAAYMMVLSSVVRRSRLTHEIRIDERGSPFLYITAFVPKTVTDLSPAESD